MGDTVVEQRRVIADLSAQLEAQARGYSLPAITSALYRAGVSADQVDAVMLELGTDHGPVDRERCRTARRITYRGETHTIGGWADRLGMSEWTLRWRLRAGWSVEEALGKTPRHSGARTFGGE